jgi:hypothetical protein
METLKMPKLGIPKVPDQQVLNVQDWKKLRQYDLTLPSSLQHVQLLCLAVWPERSPCVIAGLTSSIYRLDEPGLVAFNPSFHRQT